MSSDRPSLDEAHQWAALLSRERLAPFVRLTGSVSSAISLHLQTLRLGGQLMIVTGVIEVALRNVVCDRLDHHFDTVDWLLDPPSSFAWAASEQSKIAMAHVQARKVEYSKLSLAAKRQWDEPERVHHTGVSCSAEGRAESRTHALTVSRGQIISQLTLFFWKRLFAKDYDHALWRPILKSVLPDKSLRRPVVAGHLERIYQSRNRVAHHEPIYGGRLDEVLESIGFIAHEFGDTNAAGRRYLACLLEMDLANLKQGAAVLQDKVRRLQA